MHDPGLRGNEGGREDIEVYFDHRNWVLGTRHINISWFISLLVLGLACLSGCAPQSIGTAVIPASGQQAGSSPAIKFTETALVEQSKDNPTHVSFQNRVLEAMATRQSSWHLPGPQEALDEANVALAPFGYQLTINPNPPFSSYALYHGDQLIQANISRFWPVSVKNGGGDFLLAYQTSSGEQWMASTRGLQTWPDVSENTPPVYYGNEIAYAATGTNGVNVYAGSGMLYNSLISPSATPPVGLRKFVTWSDSTAAAAATDHWALEIGNNIILDGKDLNKAYGYEQSFGLFILNGQPMYFYTMNGITHLNYAGKDSPYTYDMVIHQNEGSTDIFNPAANANTAWFYALRDGVWYYVEAGVNQ